MSWRDMVRMVEAVLDTQLGSIGEAVITIGTTLVALAVLFLAWVASRVLRKGIQRVFEARGVDDRGTRAVVGKLLHYAIMLIGFGVALQTLGIDLTALFAAGAVFAVGIGFALQTLMQNFVSGVILMVERSITPGDVLEVEGELMRVKRMGIRSTVATTLDGEDLLLPNSTIVQNRVKNLTYDEPDFRINIGVGVSYQSDLDHVRAVLEEVARKFHDEKSHSEPYVFLSEFGDSSVVFDVAVWTRDAWGVRKLRSRVRHAIWDAFKTGSIVIAFPQLDVHFDKGTRLAS